MNIFQIFYRFYNIVIRIINLLVQFIFDKVQDNCYLSGNFAPITLENEFNDCEIIGNVPKELVGFYIRNGPNPQYKPIGRYHWFDGDGMLHGVHLSNSKARYINRFVKTSRFNEEKKKKKPVFIKIGDLVGPFAFFFVLKNLLKGKKIGGNGTANTSIEYHAGRLLALVESDLPYQVTLPQLETLGRYNFQESLVDEDSFTAHPKICPKTGEMIFFGYRFQNPYVKYHVVSKEGEITNTLPIDISVAIMMHDFAITENFALFLFLPLTFRRERILQKGKNLIMFEHKMNSKFGILPRNAKSSNEMKWFEV